MNRTRPFRLSLAPIACAAVLAAAAPALAQSNVSQTNKWSWSENCGWMNWRDAGSPAASQGVRFHDRFLSGFVWCENIGFINVGDGSPANATAYANATGADSGVNRDPATGNLTGLAWGENVGWINFGGGAMATPPNPARYDAASKRLRGYAWGENIGWINLDATGAYVALGTCSADFNQSGFVSVQDIYDFLTDWSGQSQGAPPSLGSADFNSIGGVTVQDIYDFLEAWYNGCP